jgi:O-antigen ligase
VSQLSDGKVAPTQFLGRRADGVEEKIPFLSRSRLIPSAEQGLTLSLNLFLFSLPLAHISSVRESFLGLAVFFYLASMVLQKRFIGFRTPLDWPLGLWLAMALISLIWAVNPAYTLKEIKGEILKGLLVFLLVCFSLNREDRFKQTLFILILSNLLMVLYGLWDFWLIGGKANDYYLRARSLQSGYGSYGTYLVTIFPFLVVFAFSSLLSRWRWALWILIILNILAIYLTFGRAMWLAAAFETLLLALLLKKKKLLLLLIFGLIALLIFIPKSVRFHGGQLPNGQVIVERTGGDLVDIWKLAFAHAVERPFQGIGFGRDSFSKAFQEFRAQHHPLLWHAHNTWLNIFFQTGLQGLAVFLWLILTILLVAAKKFQADPQSWPGTWALATGVMVLGFFFRNQFDDFYVDDNALMFWYLVGTMVSRNKERDNT